jgi:ArsR family transcriptional regulator, arsenate/arsenite/antimonite-responsive transcriptional repressor
VNAPSGCCSAVSEPLSGDGAELLARQFSALADPVRLRLFNLVASAATGEVCACDLAAPVGKSQPTVSHHMKLLFEAGLVTREKRGTWVWYAIDPNGLARLRAALG